MNNPKISLIIIYNNEESTISQFLESILNQNFKDFELICVNNASEDNSEKIVVDKTMDFCNVKRISFPEKLEINEAQNKSFMLISGEYICFVDAKKQIDENYVSKLYASVFRQKSNNQEFISEKMYKREFLENMDVIDKIIESKVNDKANVTDEKLTEKYKSIQQNLEQIIKNQDENNNGKIYNCYQKTEILEKTFWEKDYLYNKKFEELQKNIDAINKIDFNQINENDSKSFNYVNEQVQKIYNDMSKIYEEITKNYKYTEEIVEKAKMEVSNYSNIVEPLETKIAELEKNIVHRHVCLKRLFDMKIDELNSKLKVVSTQDVDDCQKKFDYFETSRIIENNLENVYSLINQNNTQFYQELTNIYKEMNDKMFEQLQNQKYYFDKQIIELREEFNQKIDALKK